MVDDKGGCPWVDIACIPIIPQHQLLIHINVAQDLHLLSLPFPPKSFVQSLCTTPSASPFSNDDVSSTASTIMPAPPTTYNPPGAWYVCNVKRTTPKALTSLLKVGKKRGKGSPEKEGRKRPLHMDEMTMFVEFLFGG